MISALIFSMNRVENVVKLAEKLKNYVDEIVIIDSSEKEKYQYLKEKIPYAKIYWFPPLGMADFYYKIGLELCSNDWILHLDDDEEPSDELLKDLKKLVNSDSKVYSVYRISKDKRRSQKSMRLFHKEYIIPTGLIHWVWVSKVVPVQLDERYFIIHYEEDVNIKKFKKYAVFESWQFGCKLYFSLFAEWITHRNPSKISRKIGKILWFQSKLGRVGWFLLATEYNMYFLIQWIKSPRSLKSIFYSLVYAFLIQLNLFKSFSMEQKAWMKMIEKGVFEFYGLDSYENALKNL